MHIISAVIVIVIVYMVTFKEDIEEADFKGSLLMLVIVITVIIFWFLLRSM